MRQISILVISSLLLVGSLLLAFRIKSTGASVIIVPDHLPTIQLAINSVYDGDEILVRNGTYIENVVVNKSITLVGESKNGTIIDGGEIGPAVVVTADDVIVRGFEIRCNNYSSLVWSFVLNQSSSTTVEDCLFNSVLSALQVSGGYENSILDNAFGIGSNQSCLPLGIELVNTNNSIISGNYLSFDVHTTLNLQKSHQNLIVDNYLAGHFTQRRIYLGGSNNNTFVRNLIWKYEHVDGYWDFTNSNSNRIYHNNFVDLSDDSSTIFMDGKSSNNQFDNGCEGNYWTAYNGADLNGDGIGDTNTPWDNHDYYPLINRFWIPGDVNHDLVIDIYDAVLLCTAYGSTPLDDNWNCHCDITEPYELIDINDVVLMASSYGEEYTP